MRLNVRFLVPVALVATLGGCASTSQNRQMSALEQAQYAYSAAIRWGDTRGAWGMQDPAWQATHPLTDMQVERYKQLQVTGYRAVDSVAAGPGESVRMIEIGLVNRNTMAARAVTYREGWRYDAAAKRWYVTTGLPDFWDGR